MKKIIFLLSTMGVLAIQAQDVNITFKVNMNEESAFADGDKVFVVYDADADWNWTEYNEMTDDDADGIFEYSLTVASDGSGVTQQYSFAYGAAPDDYKAWETPPAECANDNDYREITVAAGVTDEMLPAYYYGMCSDDIGGLVAVTFQVDMNDVTDLQGTVWMYDTEWNTMSDAGGGIYNITKNYNSGEAIYYSYAYQNGATEDDWADEVVPEACGGTLAKRQHIVGSSDETIAAVKLGACGDNNPTLINVTFNVDMVNETVGGQVHMVTKNPWHWQELNNTADDIYSATFKLFEGQEFPYTFVNGGVNGWDGEESVPAECNFGTETAPERWFDGVSEDTDLPAITFGECLDATDKYNVSIKVDMSDVSDLFDGGEVWLNVDGWTNYYTMTDDDGDNVYEYAVSMAEGEELKYVFSYQTGADPNNDYVDETVPEACATNGQRMVTGTNADQTVAAVKLGQCDGTPIKSLSSKVLNVYPNPANENIAINFGESVSGQLLLTDLAGRTLITKQLDNKENISINISDLTPEVYVISVVTQNEIFKNRLVVK